MKLSPPIVSENRAEYQREYNRRYGHRYPPKLSNQIINRRKNYARAKARVSAYKETHPCIDCGETEPVLLDFHHREPNEKKFCVSRGRGLATLDREMAKCILLCSNCHRKRHFGIVNSIGAVAYA